MPSKKSISPRLIRQVEIDGHQVLADMTRYYSTGEPIYFNATQLARTLGSKIRVRDWTRSKPTQEYIEALKRQGMTAKNLAVIDPHIRVANDGFSYVLPNRREEGGTYLHPDLLIEFLRGVNRDFAVAMDQWIKQKILEKGQGKLAREEGKVGRSVLTDEVQKYQAYAQLQGSTHQEHAFGNATRTVEGIVLPKIQGEKRYPVVRDRQGPAALIALDSAERIFAMGLRQGMARQLPYKECYQLARQYVLIYAAKIPPEVERWS